LPHRAGVRPVGRSPGTLPEGVPRTWTAAELVTRREQTARRPAPGSAGQRAHAGPPPPVGDGRPASTPRGGALPVGPEAHRSIRAQRHSGRTGHDRTGRAATARSPPPAGQECERQDSHQRDHGGAVLGDPFESLLEHARLRPRPPLHPAGHVPTGLSDLTEGSSPASRRLASAAAEAPQSTGWCCLAPCYGRVRITTSDGAARPCPPGSTDTGGTPRAAGRSPPVRPDSPLEGHAR
jgi:hypothetical protein